jgi:hypothetical protein
MGHRDRWGWVVSLEGMAQPHIFYPNRYINPSKVPKATAQKINWPMASFNSRAMSSMSMISSSTTTSCGGYSLLVGIWAIHPLHVVV